MSDFQYAATLFRTRADMLAAIALDWASGGGMGEQWVRESFATMTDEALAADCIKSWELDAPSGAEELDYETGEYVEKPSHMEAQGYTPQDLAAAFADLRDASR